MEPVSAARPLAAEDAARDALLGVGGAPVSVEADSSALAERVMDWLTRAFLLTVDTAPSQAPLWLRVQAGNPMREPPAGARELVASDSWRVLRHGEVVFLSFPQARCILDLDAGRAELWLSEGWWGEPLKVQQDPWLLTLVWLLRERGLYALHASAVVRDGQCLLIVGDSGSGKSSTALSLVHVGWNWLADDLVLFEPGSPPRVHAFARGFAFHPGLGERLTGLKGEVVAEKRFADLETHFTGRQVASARAAVLLFPRVTHTDRSCLDRLSSAEALMALLPASGGILAGGAAEQSQAQLTALRDLVAGAPAYRLDAGRDIFGDGMALEALLAAQGIALGG